MPFRSPVRKPTISRGMGAYADPRYLESLAEFGEPVWLPESGAGLLVQSIPGTRFHDARGPYPLLACRRVSALAGELSSRQVPWVSLSAVVDPFSAPAPNELYRAFPDLCRVYKSHFVVDLTRGYRAPFAEGHRRNLRRAARRVEVERVASPLEAFDDWHSLYAELCRQKGIEGMAAFSETAFRGQFALEGLAVYRAWSNGEAVAMTLWLVDEDRAYYHLGASSPAGYGASAMFALFDRALSDFASAGIGRVLLGAGAGTVGDPNDGLNRFKAGWANGSMPAYLVGRIFDRVAYAQLSADRDEAYFPAYRGSAKATAAM